jgi:hypothetical protein
VQVLTSFIVADPFLISKSIAGCYPERRPYNEFKEVSQAYPLGPQNLDTAKNLLQSTFCVLTVLSAFLYSVKRVIRE